MLINPRVALALADLVDVLHAVLMVHCIVTCWYIGKTTKFVKNHKIQSIIAVSFSLGSLLFLFFGGCPITHLAETLRKIANPNFSFGDSYVIYYVKQYTGIQLPSLFLTMTLIGMVVIAARSSFRSR